MESSQIREDIARNRGPDTGDCYTLCDRVGYYSIAVVGVAILTF